MTGIIYHRRDGPSTWQPKQQKEEPIPYESWKAERIANSSGLTVEDLAWQKMSKDDGFYFGLGDRIQAREDAANIGLRPTEGFRQGLAFAKSGVTLLKRSGFPPLVLAGQVMDIPLTLGTLWFTYFFEWDVTDPVQIGGLPWRTSSKGYHAWSDSSIC